MNTSNSPARKSEIRPPLLGERLPRHRAAQTSNGPLFNLDMLAGRYALFCVYGSASNPVAQEALAQIVKNSSLFDAEQRVFVALSNDPRDKDQAAIQAVTQTALFVWDDDLAVISNWGLISEDGQSVRACWMLTDPQFRILGLWSLDQADAAMAAFSQLGKPEDHAGFEQIAPVLVVPRVFEPEFCDRLMKYYDDEGGEESGVTRERDGKTLVELSPKTKRRRDCMIEDAELRSAAMARIYYRLAPEIEKAFNFRATRMERYLIGRYGAGGTGFFKAHRDNTTKGTAHRRFAVSVGLNDDYEGGELIFREYGLRRYKPPRGGAVVFGCSLMHEVEPVTAGTRFAFLPFLYDDAAAEIRAANNQFLDDSVGAYNTDNAEAASDQGKSDAAKPGEAAE